MIKLRTRNTLLASVAVLALFAGCKGESPTSPGSGPTTPPGGNVTPPSGASITLTVSNAQPLVDSSSVITATVTQNGSPVVNGTAVEFDTTLGTFTEANAGTVIRTTTNGVATVTLTSPTAGVATITATVNNVSKNATVTFNLKPVVQPPPNTSPTITNVSPTLGRPQGGELVTITGTNFSSPKVIFDFGGGKTVEAFPVSATSTQIQVLTPGVDLGVGQQKIAQIIVINNVGTPNEVRITASQTFTFQAEVLTPKITTVSPATGPTEGGTRVTIFGEGFQAPIQVFFGSAEAQLASAVTFNQFSVIAPNASQTTPNGSGLVTGPVDIKVININSATNVTASGVFRYVAKMVITTISPVAGSALGGTDIEIDGQGLTGEVTVDVGSPPIRATVTGVFGTRITARTGRLPSPCGANTGPVTVTAVGNGDVAASSAPQVFTYIAVNPFLNSATPGASPFTLGSPFTFVVTNPGIGLLGDAIVSATLGGKPVVVSPNPLTVGTGAVTFSSAVPASGFTFPSVACTVGPLTGTQFGPLTAELVFTNNTTSCTATLLNALTIQPPAPNPCVVPPTATVTSPAQTCPAPNLSPATVASAGAVTHTATITITNAAGASTLNLGAPSATPTNATVTVSPNTAQTVAGGGSQNYTVTVDPTAAGADGASITFTTNDPTKPTITITVCGNAT